MAKKKESESVDFGVRISRLQLQSQLHQQCLDIIFEALEKAGLIAKGMNLAAENTKATDA